ncbi:hypothetical protein RJ640_009463 [Escallonia rubra]|uniref:Calcineurin-like phosphoesterase domain-containing protein n=1 Tax=Escallonia rubra TaxID=112253 RepID=A0AA88UWJ1_9ASTE|nr:hypothetical protein RJ640_009463 [Escallonia rubra]
MLGNTRRVQKKSLTIAQREAKCRPNGEICIYHVSSMLRSVLGEERSGGMERRCLKYHKDNKQCIHENLRLHFSYVSNISSWWMQPDLVLFTGDLGNENVELVRSIADLRFPKAVILGNHDAWTTTKFSVMRKDPVQLQLECLGEEHVGYRRLDFPMLKLSIVGGRPFSCGGDQLFRKRLLSARYGVHNMAGSANKIYGAAVGAPEDHCLVLLAHNGPTGLGSNIYDICGRDWVSGGGDHGDPDLAHAISQLKETKKLPVPLVVFGHMHKELAYGNGLRKMVVVGDDSTIYLNGAIVPRVKRLYSKQGTSSTSSLPLSTPNLEGSLRAFTLVEIVDGQLEKIAETWVSVTEDKATIEEEHILYSCGPSVSELSL